MTRLKRYTFSDGSYAVAETIEQACTMQKTQGRSARVVKAEVER
jgi:hypothetical protein